MTRKDRIEQLKEELRTRGGQFHVADAFDEQLTESFLEHVLLCEKAERKSMRDWLTQSGFDPSAGLQHLLEHLAFLGIAVEFADHLSDDELHSRLIQRFDDEIALIPGCVLHLEMVGHGGDNEDLTWLTYYASDEYRAEWKKHNPDEELPSKKEPLYKREMPEAFRGETDAS